MSDSTASPSTMRVQDATGRRRFMRRGAALVAAGAPLLASGQALADCDHGDTTAAGKQAQAATSDSDQGASADPAGCGRKDTPKISRAQPPSPNPTPVRIETVKG